MFAPKRNTCSAHHPTNVQKSLQETKRLREPEALNDDQERSLWGPLGQLHMWTHGDCASMVVMTTQ